MDTTTPALQGRGRRALRLAWTALVWLELPAIAIWLGAAVGLAAITSRVVDWFVMTDELLYERLAISVAHLHSPLPRVHGELIPNVSQLYPLLIAPVFAHGLVPTSLHDAHVLNAYIMASAAIPAFFLTRRVTGRRLLSCLVALLSVCVPWMVFTSFLLTEVAAYPAFLWAVLALQHATVAPRLRNDVLALLGIAVATLARTQFFVLVLVLGVAILVHELSYGTGRPRAAFRNAVSGHRLVAVVYVLLGLGAIALAATGRLSDALGTYAAAIEGNPFPEHFVPSLAEHLAVIGLGLGVLPFVVGGAWLGSGLLGAATPERHAFAAIGAATVAVLAVEVTSFDLRFGGGVVRERYLFYVVPVILVAFAAALSDRRWPRWSLLVPTGLLVYGFSQATLPLYDKLNIDTPVSVLDNELLKLAHSLSRAQLLLIVATLIVTALFVEASLFLRHSHLAALLALLSALALPAETGYAFSRLFDIDGTSGRPLTLDQGVVFDWVDRTLGTNESVTMVPFPMRFADFWAGVGQWWDTEFWNKSVDRAAYLPGQYLWTPSTFPRLFLRFDPKTGLANTSPTRYVLEAEVETRFRIAGVAVSNTRETLLIKPEQPWRAEWLTFGLYDDGWTRRNSTARIRIFATPEQTGSITRQLTLGIRAPLEDRSRAFRIVSNRTDVRGVANDLDRVLTAVEACVPAHGFTDVRVTTPEHSRIFGDMTSATTFFGHMRTAGVVFTQIALADELGRPC